MDRRRFLNLSLAGLAVPHLISTRAHAKTEQASPEKTPSKSETKKPVRLGVIGTGARGTDLMHTLVSMPDVEFPALCDIDTGHLENGINIVLTARKYRPVGYSKGPLDYRRMLERNDLDAVLIATPAPMHAKMAIDCLNAGKDVGSEVPGAYTVEECQGLVEAKEKSGRHYMLLENYTYAQERMMIYNMIRKGLFGDLYYGECAYLHETDFLNFNRDGSLTWRGELRRDSLGNWYPTHSIGPVSKWMGIHDGDRLESILCMQSAPVMAHLHAVEKFGPDSPQAHIKWSTGEYICCLVQTTQGRMIKLDFGPLSPRPEQVYYGIQGTKGGWDSRLGIFLKGITDIKKGVGNKFESLEVYREEYESRYWREMGLEAAKSGHDGGDYLVLQDFLKMVREQREPWIDVYDSTGWSILYLCSRQSMEQGHRAVPIPDFTAGRWKKTDWRKNNLNPV